MGVIQDLAANKSLNKEEKEIMMKKLADDFLAKEKELSRQDRIEKSRKQAKENRTGLEQINYNSSLKEQMEILSFLKSNNGESQFSKSYLLTLRGSELMQIYAECMETMPEAMEKAKEERAKAKEENQIIFEDYNLGETKTEEEKEGDLKEEKKSDESTNEELETSRIDEIANRLGVDTDRVVDAANYKHGKSLENEPELQKKGKEFAENDGKGRQKVSKFHVAGEKLKNALNHKAVKAALVAGAGVAAIALLVINAPVALGAAAVALVGSEINKGRKGR